MLKIIVIAFLVVFLYKLSSNVSAFLRIRYYEGKYEKYTCKNIGDFEEYTSQVVTYFYLLELNLMGLNMLQFRLRCLTHLHNSKW